MTDLKDPPRLLDSASGAPQGLRDALDAATRDVGSAEQLSRLAGRLGPLFAMPVPAPPAASSAGLSAAAKLGLTAIALLAAGGGAWLLSTSESAPPPAPTRVAVPPAPPPAEPAAPAPQASAPPESAVAKPAEPPAAQVVPAKPAPAAQLSEAELLEQARSALKGDPARALARANEHRRRFPGGVLVQEREVIAIQALRQLGRASEAEQRAEAFSKAFPGSAFQRKLKPARE
jgi:hypothetical protein